VTRSNGIACLPSPGALVEAIHGGCASRSRSGTGSRSRSRSRSIHGGTVSSIHLASHMRRDVGAAGLSTRTRFKGHVAHSTADLVGHDCVRRILEERMKNGESEGVVFFQCELLVRNESFGMSRVAFGHSHKERGVQMRVFRKKTERPRCRKSSARKNAGRNSSTDYAVGLVSHVLDGDCLLRSFRRTRKQIFKRKKERQG